MGLRGSAPRAASLAVGPPTGSNEGPPRASGPAAGSCPPSVAGPSAHLFSDLARIAVSKGLNCVHLNVRSLLPKIDEIRLFAFNARAEVICITESWLDPSISDSQIELSNYTVVRRDRSRKGGGVCAFVRNDIDFTVRTDWDEDIEVLLLDIHLPKTKPLLVGVCYRPPDQSVFYESLENVMNICGMAKSLCIFDGYVSKGHIQQELPYI